LSVTYVCIPMFQLAMFCQRLQMFFYYFHKMRLQTSCIWTFISTVLIIWFHVYFTLGRTPCFRSYYPTDWMNLVATALLLSRLFTLLNRGYMWNKIISVAQKVLKLFQNYFSGQWHWSCWKIFMSCNNPQK